MSVVCEAILFSRGTNISEEPLASIFWMETEDRSSKFLRNICICVSSYSVS
jgi:hypothetical protein